jgi:hypothetical protein
VAPGLCRCRGAGLPRCECRGSCSIDHVPPVNASLLLLLLLLLLRRRRRLCVGYAWRLRSERCCLRTQFNSAVRRPHKAGGAGVGRTQMPDAELRAIFRTIDTDSTGSISWAEWMEFLQGGK